MDLQDVLLPHRTFINLPASSQKRAFDSIATLLGDSIPGLSAQEILERLIGRERLGSTGLGYGVAIPHCRVPNLSEVVAALVKLEQPIDYSAPDDQPVDLLFTLLVPEEATEVHLQLLAKLAERFSDPDYRQRLRQAPDEQTLYQRAIAPLSH